MTFTEAPWRSCAAPESLSTTRKLRKLRWRDNLLSHVGQDPEITMGQRLAAMAKREDDRKVVAVLPEDLSR